MGEIRDRLVAALGTIEELGAGIFDLALRPAASDQQIAEVEAEFGMRLPDDLRELYLLHDGQAQYLNTARLFASYPFAPLRAAVALWRQQVDFWGLEPGHPDITGHENAALDPELRQVPADIRWFPFGTFTNEMKSALFVDLHPPVGRPLGQVILEGAWAHPAQFVGESVLDVLETYAAGIRAGLVGVRPAYTQYTWGFGPALMPLEYVKRELATVGPPRFGGSISGEMPQTVDQVGDLSGVHSVTLHSATSVEGLAESGVRSLALFHSPEVSLAPLAEASIVDLVVHGTAPRLRTDLPSVLSIHLAPTSAADLAILKRLPGVKVIALDLGNLDPNDADWDVRGQPALWLRGGSLSSMEFARPFSHVGVASPRDLHLRGLAVEETPRSFRFVDVPVPDDLDVLTRLRLPAMLHAPREWEDLIGGRVAPGVWVSVFDGGDDSTWSDRTAANWARRRRELKAAGLPEH